MPPSRPSFLRARIALSVCATLFGLAFTCRPASAGYTETELYTVNMADSSGRRQGPPFNPSFVENVYNPGALATNGQLVGSSFSGSQVFSTSWNPGVNATLLSS